MYMLTLCHFTIDNDSMLFSSAKLLWIALRTDECDAGWCPTDSEKFGSRFQWWSGWIFCLKSGFR